VGTARPRGRRLGCARWCAAINPQHRPDADAKLARDTADARALAAHCTDSSDLGRVGVLRRLRPSFVSSSLARAKPALTRSRIIAWLELGEYAHHLEHSAPRRCGRVEAPLVEEQINALGVQLLEERKQVHQ
jgi:hypothetical protein